MSEAPLLDLNGGGAGTGVTTAYTEGQGAVQIAPAATVTDSDSPDFDGGTLTVSLSGGGQDSDRLVIVDGFGILVGEYQLFYDFGRQDGQGNPIGPELIATFSGGNDGSTPLAITFNANASAAVVQAVVRAIGFYNISLAMTPADRTFLWVLSDGDGASSLSATSVIDVTATDNPASVGDDGFFVDENQVIASGNLFANDFDPDGPPLAVAQVNGQPANVGSEIILPSGARLTVRADGTFDYDPNGQFDTLTDTSSGAVNVSATDSFTYTLADGGSATVTITIAGIISEEDLLYGDANDNVIVGPNTGDIFLMMDGGTDSVFGNGGNDYIYFGSTLDQFDSVNGGAGTDTLALMGNYNLTLGAGQLTGIERLVLYSASQGGPASTSSFASIAVVASNDYTLTTTDAAVAAGTTLTIVARNLGPAEELTFNGSAETDGQFFVLGGAGADIIAGGGQADYIRGGDNDDQIYGRGGDDILFGGYGADLLRGGAGHDGFIYEAWGESTAASTDTIADYQGVDRIDLSAIDANGNESDGDTAFTFIGSDDFTQSAGQLRVTQGRSFWIVEGDVDGDGLADLVIHVTVNDGTILGADEFVL